MAKSLSKQLEEAENAEFINVESDDVTELQGDIDDTLSGIKAEFDADENDVVFFIKVYRVEPKTGKSSWLFNCQPEELPIMEKLRDSYGTGIYQVRVYKNQKLNRRFNYQIEAPKMVDRPQNNQTDIAGVLKVIAENNQKQFDQMRQMMLEIATQKNQNSIIPQPAFNPMDMMTGMVALMVNMKQLMPPPADTGNNMDFLLKGMEFMKDFQGGGSETSMLDIVRDLIKSPMLEKVIEATTTMPTIRENPSTPKIPAQITSPQNNPTTQPNTGTEKMNPIIEGYINTLVKKAAGGSDPELYAEFILDNVPEKMIRENIVRDDLMEFITKINPEAAQYSDWFMKLKNCIQQFLDDDSEENLTEAPDTANTSVNEHEPDNNATSNSKR